MQILGLSDSTPQPENRIKSLFWPRVRYQEDVDYLGAQGYWVCVVVALVTILGGLLSHRGWSTSLDALYFYLAGVGIRQRSRFAAITAVLVYLLNVVVIVRIAHTGSIASIFFLALLTSNVRATWLSAGWKASPGEGLFVPVKRTAMEWFSDVLPRGIWTVGRWLLYILTVLELVGLFVLLFSTRVRPNPV